MTDYYVLLEDKDAYKEKEGWYPIRTSYSKEHIPKGTLLVKLTKVESEITQPYFPSPLNYKMHSNHTIKLHCEPDKVHQLTESQFHLLLGIRNSLDCYKSLRILNWAEKLAVGDTVNVNLFSDSAPTKGKIQYIGILFGEEGTKFGIELMVCNCACIVMVVKLLHVHNCHLCKLTLTLVTC